MVQGEADLIREAFQGKSAIISNAKGNGKVTNQKA